MGSHGRKASFDQKPRMLGGQVVGRGGGRGRRLPTREEQCCETQDEGVFKLMVGPSTIKKHLSLCYECISF